jgi:hypothetical protein
MSEGGEFFFGFLKRNRGPRHYIKGGVKTMMTTNLFTKCTFLGTLLFLHPSAFGQAIYTRNVLTVKASLTLDQHDIVLADASGGAFTITLPSTANLPAGRHYTIKKVDNTTRVVTITAQTGQNIDGQASYTLVNPNQEARITTNDVTPNWNVLSEVPKNVLNAHTFPGANASAKIIAALASCPDIGCVVDARGLQGAQTISQTIQLGDPTTAAKPVQVLLGVATFSASVCPAFELVGNSTVLEGLSEGNYTDPKQPANPPIPNSSTIIKAATGCAGPLVRIRISPSPTVEGASGLKGATVRRLRIDGNARTAATGIEIAADQNFRNTIEDVSIGNVGTGILAGNNVSSHRINRVVIGNAGTGLDFGQGNMRDMVVSNSTISGDVQAFVVGAADTTRSEAVAFTNCDMTASSDVTIPLLVGQVRNISGLHITGGWFEYDEPPTIGIASIQRSGGVVTVITKDNHLLQQAHVNQNVIIAGVSEPSLNGTFPIASVSPPKTFTFVQQNLGDTPVFLGGTERLSTTQPSMIILGSSAGIANSVMATATGAHFVGNAAIDYAIELRNTNYPAVVFNDFNNFRVKDVLVTDIASGGLYWGNQPGGAAGLPVSQTTGLTAISPGDSSKATAQPIFPLGIVVHGQGLIVDAPGTGRWAAMCTGVATASTLFIAMPWSGGACAKMAEDVTTELLVPARGILRNLQVKARVGGVNAQTSGIVTLRVNGADTPLTCTLGTGTTCADTTHTASLAAGNVITIRMTTQGPPTETLADVQVAFEY